jgi:GNAT superfamily N-acetyltransferase
MALTVRPVDAASFADVQKVFGERGHAHRCQCQGFRQSWHALHTDNVDGRRELLRDQVAEGHGLLARLDDDPVGWCSLGPRSDYPYLRRPVWAGRSEDKHDPTVWAVTCFVTRVGFRNQGVSRALAAATVDAARDAGARAVEAYAMNPEPGKDVTWGELHVGKLTVFLAAGYRIVHTPSLRRAIVRHDF